MTVLNDYPKNRALASGHCANLVRHLMQDEKSLAAVDATIAFGEGRMTRAELFFFENNSFSNDLYKDKSIDDNLPNWLAANAAFYSTIGSSYRHVGLAIHAEAYNAAYDAAIINNSEGVATEIAAKKAKEAEAAVELEMNKIWEKYSTGNKLN